MLFPKGKSKALILSYDDGRNNDRRLVKLLNKYRLIGTFHLSSNKLGTENYLKKEEIRKLFENHEVAIHTANHPNLTKLTEREITREISNDKKELERLMGYPIRGMAYPFGKHNDTAVKALRNLGIVYARTITDSYNFDLPKNFLEWNPTIHQFRKAYRKGVVPNNDKNELAQFFLTVNDFLKTKKIVVMEVWGHSWEYSNDESKWKEVAKFYKMVAHNPAIHYSTHIALADYYTAYKNLKFTTNKSIVYNPSTINVYIKMNKKVYRINAGKRYRFQN